MKIVLLIIALFALGMTGEPPQSTIDTASPEDAKAWSDAIVYIFDAWWERILLVLSVLANFGLLTKTGQKLANKANPLNKNKE